jgi:hypothetical protein
MAIRERSISAVISLGVSFSEAIEAAGRSKESGK